MFKIMFSVFFLSTSALGAVLLTNNDLASPQPALFKSVVTVQTATGDVVLNPEVATTPLEQKVGMAGRRGIDLVDAMFFPFTKPDRRVVKVEDAPSLDVVLIGRDHAITMVVSRTTAFSTTEILPDEPLAGVIELKGGYAEQLGIEVGDNVKSEAFLEEPETSQPALSTTR